MEHHVFAMMLQKFICTSRLHVD